MKAVDNRPSHPPTRTRPAGRPRRAVLLLAVATAIGSLGLAAGGTAAALLAVAMTGTEAAAGLPLGALAAGQTGTALLVAGWTSRAGRGAGLVLGYAIGMLGASVVIVATVRGGFPVLLAGSLLLGGANAAIFLSRYAAADVVGPRAPGRALGTVLFATTIGTVAGPALLVPTGRLAQALGLPQLAGLYLVAVIAFAGAALAVAGLSRSGLPSLARGSPVTGADQDRHRAVTWARLAAALRPAPARAALLVLGATNLVMIAIMAVAPVLLMAHGHDLGFIGLAVSVHVLAMFAPSPVTGWLTDRVGGATVASAGAALLILAGSGGVLVDHASGPAMVAVLVVLGLGWNCGVVGGSALLAASVPDEARPHSEGIGEASMGLAAAAGAPAAGLLVAVGGFATLCLAGAALGAVILARTRRP
jgi:predicted MFS family arabinose efflux permease